MSTTRRQFSAPLMEGKGLVVQWKQMPVSHYRSKRRKWPKSTVTNDAIDFLQRIPKEKPTNRKQS
jgi:hypothetical protein